MNYYLSTFILKLMDYYEILNIPQNASPKDIRKNYLLLSKKYHPDKNKGSKQSEDLFKQISEAYTILSDPQKRLYYARISNQCLSLEKMELFTLIRLLLVNCLKRYSK